MGSMERFAFAVANVDDLAPSVRTALLASLEPGEAIRQMIFAPRQEQPALHRGWRSWLSAWLLWPKTPAWVLALTGERLLVATIADEAAEPKVTIAPLRDLLWLELGAILLYAWFEVSWAGPEGPQHQRVYFNTVSDGLFWSLVNAMRRTIVAQSGRLRPESRRDPKVFDGLPFKFRNLIPNRLMLGDEQVQALVWQPAIWERRWGLFRRQRTPATALVLSPDHLLVAQDDVSQTNTSYGLIARYVPRDRLRGAALERVRDDLWLEVALGIGTAEERLRYMFAPEAATTLEHLVGQCDAAVL